MKWFISTPIFCVIVFLSCEFLLGPSLPNAESATDTTDLNPPDRLLACGSGGAFVISSFMDASTGNIINSGISNYSPFFQFNHTTGKWTDHYGTAINMVKGFDECKSFDQGNTVLVTDSDGPGSGYVLQRDGAGYYKPIYEFPPVYAAHSAEFLPGPDGKIRVVVAQPFPNEALRDKMGNPVAATSQITILESDPSAVSTPSVMKKVNQVTSRGVHGLVWDSARSLLWVDGANQLAAYSQKISADPIPTVNLCMRYSFSLYDCFPSQNKRLWADAHDMTLIKNATGEDELVISTQQGVCRLSIEALVTARGDQMGSPTSDPTCPNANLFAVTATLPIGNTKYRNHLNALMSTGVDPSPLDLNYLNQIHSIKGIDIDPEGRVVFVTPILPQNLPDGQKNSVDNFSSRTVWMSRFSGEDFVNLTAENFKDLFVPFYVFGPHHALPPYDGNHYDFYKVRWLNSGRSSGLWNGSR